MTKNVDKALKKLKKELEDQVKKEKRVVTILASSKSKTMREDIEPEN